MKGVLFASIIAIIFASGKALKCYQTAEIDQPFNKSNPTIECASDLDTCVTAKMAGVGESLFIIRDCTENFESFYEYDESNDVIDDAFISVDHCDFDYCNGARSFIMASSILFANLFIFIFTNY